MRQAFKQVRSAQQDFFIKIEARVMKFNAGTRTQEKEDTRNFLLVAGEIFGNHDRFIQNVDSKIFAYRLDLFK